MAKAKPQKFTRTCNVVLAIIQVNIMLQIQLEVIAPN
jgi:hypothetical protein